MQVLVGAGEAPPRLGEQSQRCHVQWFAGFFLCSALLCDVELTTLGCLAADGLPPDAAIAAVGPQLVAYLEECPDEPQFAQAMRQLLPQLQTRKHVEAAAAKRIIEAGMQRLRAIGGSRQV